MTASPHRMPCSVKHEVLDAPALQPHQSSCFSSTPHKELGCLVISLPPLFYRAWDKGDRTSLVLPAITTLLFYASSLCFMCLRQIDLGWLPGAHQAAPSVPSINRTGGEIR